MHLDLESPPLSEHTLNLFGSKTRDQILRDSLLLFNEKGFHAVTTAAIAKGAGVLEGALWYHFPSKKDILLTHIGLLKDVFEKTHSDVSELDAKSVIQGVFDCYNLIWDFRYVLRDPFETLLAADDGVFDVVQKTNDFFDDWTVGRMLHAKELGILNLPPENMESTSEVILLIGRYWLDFCNRKYPNQPDAFLRAKGMRLIVKTLEPHFEAQSLSWARQMLLDMSR
ncbi:MAG: TetR family transcriptional regulator [Flavobacteriales bacterium]